MLKSFEIIFDGYSDLSKEASTVSIIYLSLIRGEKFISFQKINVIILDSKDIGIDVIGLEDRICNINVRTDLIFYRQQEEAQKRKLLYEMAFYAMDFLCEKMCWLQSPFEELKKTVIKHNYLVPYTKLKKKKNRKTGFSAELNILFSFNKASFVLFVYDKNGKFLKSIDVKDAFPHYLIYDNFFYKGNWISDSIFQIEDVNSEILFQVNIDLSSVQIKFEPWKSDLLTLRNRLLALSYETSNEDRIKYMTL